MLMHMVKINYSLYDFNQNIIVEMHVIVPTYFNVCAVSKNVECNCISRTSETCNASNKLMKRVYSAFIGNT